MFYYDLVPKLVSAKTNFFWPYLCDSSSLYHRQFDFFFKIIEVAHGRRVIESKRFKNRLEIPLKDSFKCFASLRAASNLILRFSASSLTVSQWLTRSFSCSFKLSSPCSLADFTNEFMLFCLVDSSRNRV